MPPSSLCGRYYPIPGKQVIIIMHTFSRRSVVGSSIAGLIPASSFATTTHRSATPMATPGADSVDDILAIANRAMKDLSLRAVLLHVTIDDEVRLHHALGETMSGVPATPDMHVRNGAVAITYMSTTLLRLVDEGQFALDDTIDAWLPDLPDADQATLRMLAQMTSGYQNYVQNPDFIAAFYEDPFRIWTTEEQLAYGFAMPRVFAPGENWSYSHTDYVILGLVLEVATSEPLDALLRRHILEPLDLANTASEQTAALPEPVLHATTSERRDALDIPAGIPFVEDSTFWNPSWTLARGSVQYSTVADMAASFARIGKGDILSPSSMEELLTTNLLGFGSPLEGCASCHTFDATRLYGLGVWLTGGWMFQNPLFAGFGSIAAYHPEARIAISIASTYADGGDTAGWSNVSTAICKDISALLMPDDPMFAAAPAS